MSDKKTPEEHRKKLARAKINNAIRDGKMKKPKKCSICGSTKNVQWHHVDYRSPKKVRAICMSCHQKKTGNGKR